MLAFRSFQFLHFHLTLASEIYWFIVLFAAAVVPYEKLGSYENISLQDLNRLSLARQCHGNNIQVFEGNAVVREQTPLHLNFFVTTITVVKKISCIIQCAEYTLLTLFSRSSKHLK